MVYVRRMRKCSNLTSAGSVYCRVRVSSITAVGATKINSLIFADCVCGRIRLTRVGNVYCPPMLGLTRVCIARITRHGTAMICAQGTMQ